MIVVSILRQVFILNKISIEHYKMYLVRKLKGGMQSSLYLVLSNININNMYLQ